MLNTTATAYDAYVQTFAKVRSGTQMKDSDFVVSADFGVIPFSTEQRCAAALAIDDVKSSTTIRSQKDVSERIQALLTA